MTEGVAPRRRWPRWAVAIGAVLALPVALVLWHVGHYATTPSFAAYVAQVPIPDETLRGWLPHGGEPVDVERVFRTGTVDPFDPPPGEERRTWVTTATLRFHREEQELGRAVVEMAATAPQGRDRDGFGVRVVELSVASNLHGALALDLRGDSLVGAGSAGQGVVGLCFVVAAGVGDDEVVFRRDGQGPTRRGRVLSASSFWEFARGLVLPPGGVADEGFVARLEQKLYAMNTLVEGGKQGLGVGDVKAEVSSREHSLGVESVVATVEDDRPASTQRFSRESHRSFNGHLW